MNEKELYDFQPDEDGYYWYAPFIPGFKREAYFHPLQEKLLYSELEGIHVIIGKPDECGEITEDVPERFDYPIVVNIAPDEYFADHNTLIKQCADPKEFIDFVSSSYLRLKGCTLDEALGL